MHSLEAQLLSAWPLERWQDLGLLVAVSGGPDSVALLRALRAVAPAARLIVGHFDHRLRGPESDADRQFVVDLARRMGLPVELGAGEPAAVAAGKDGIEAAARAERYAFLQGAAERAGARYVVTGHTADDQVETVLHRIIRGTGIAGLAGMPRVRPLSAATTLIRPLLACRRVEVLAYLEFLGQSFRLDSTNCEFGFTRNRLRHQLLPELERNYNPGVAEALLRLSRLAGDAQEIVDRSVAALADRVAAPPPAGAGSRAIAIQCGPLADQPRHLVRELLVHVWRKQGWPEQSMGLAEWDRLAGLCAELETPASAPPAVQMFPGGVRAERSGAILHLGAP
ncbi:MAG: tRNA lysidine(34) synthetase TilS [Planctomycetaceae bacterium]|nr:tRNA lysidine(34) synthetase TilS [Planctomycetaceae bacterium]